MNKCVVKSASLQKETFTLIRANGLVVEAKALPNERGFLPRFSDYPEGTAVMCQLLTDGKRFYVGKIFIDPTALKAVEEDKAELAEVTD